MISCNISDRTSIVTVDRARDNDTLPQRILNEVSTLEEGLDGRKDLSSQFSGQVGKDIVTSLKNIRKNKIVRYN
jgi:hypothetical protein